MAKKFRSKLRDGRSASLYGESMLDRQVRKHKEAALARKAQIDDNVKKAVADHFEVHRQTVPVTRGESFIEQVLRSDRQPGPLFDTPGERAVRENLLRARLGLGDLAAGQADDLSRMSDEEFTRAYRTINAYVGRATSVPGNEGLPDVFATPVSAHQPVTPDRRHPDGVQSLYRGEDATVVAKTLRERLREALTLRLYRKTSGEVAERRYADKVAKAKAELDAMQRVAAGINLGLEPVDELGRPVGRLMVGLTIDDIRGTNLIDAFNGRAPRPSIRQQEGRMVRQPEYRSNLDQAREEAALEEADQNPFGDTPPVTPEPTPIPGMLCVECTHPAHVMLALPPDNLRVPYCYYCAHGVGGWGGLLDNPS